MMRADLYLQHTISGDLIVIVMSHLLDLEE
jgi:hypothetical protein